MPLMKSRRRASERERFNHLDALGGIELKAYVKHGEDGGAAAPPAARLLVALAQPLTLPRC